MPSGYTAIIGEKDNVKFQEFALLCARAFGATILMRDDSLDVPIPEEFQPTDYHSKQLKKANWELDKVKQMTDAQIKRAILKEFNEEVARITGYIEKDRILAEKYGRMICDVQAWKPPTDEHKEMKNFMLQQLHESLKFDCGLYSETDIPKTMPSIDEWRKKKIEKIARDITYHTEENQKEIERTNKRNLWIKQLRESL
jgi:hypothetical protein